MKKYLLFLLLPLFLYSKVQVTVTYPFEEFLVKKIGQKQVRIIKIDNLYHENLTSLSKAQIAKLATRKAYFHISLPIENEYIKILKKRNDELFVFDMSKGIKKLKYKGKDNPYIWMDPLLTRQIAKNIYEGLVQIDKFNKEYYFKYYMDFLDELDQTFLKIKEKLNDSEIYNIFVYDEYWDYFLKRYKINTFRRDKRYVKLSEVHELSKLVKYNEIKAVLISSTDSIDIAQTLAGNLNLKIKTHNIFEKLYFYNLSMLTKELSK